MQTECGRCGWGGRGKFSAGSTREADSVRVDDPWSFIFDIPGYTPLKYKARGSLHTRTARV